MSLCLESSVAPPTHTIIQTQSTTGILAILRHLGLEGLAQELLSAGGVHDLGNTLSLDVNTHSQFNILSLWFEGTDKVRHL